MRVEISKYARFEIEDAYEYYKNEHIGLAVRFKEELARSLDRIELFPYIFAIYTAGIRRAVIRSFPYSIFFEVFDQRIVVVAVAHHKREPNYWSTRASI